MHRSVPGLRPALRLGSYVYTAPPPPPPPPPLVPAPDFSHDFTGAALPSGFTFTRLSAGNYINSSGVLTSAANDAARFDYDPVTHACKGLLIERQRTNLFLYAQDFSNASWTKTACTVTADTTGAPDGTTTGDKIVESNVTGTHGVTVNASFASSGTYALSCFAKAGERS